MRRESDYAAGDGLIDDPMLAGVVAAWPSLPLHLRAQIDGIIRGRPLDRACPRCRVRRTIAKVSHRKGRWQLRTMLCKNCNHRFPQLVLREYVATRKRRPSAP